MLIYGNSQTGLGQTFHALVRISLAVGGFCCFCIALFREKIDPLIRNFFLPAIGIMSCLLVPRTTVYIQDHLAQKAASTQAVSFTKVENVPFFLGKLAELVSTVSYKFTNALEGVAHNVKDKLYDWTGHIYADENLFLTKKCRISNPIVEDNFREFCRECVFRDLGVGVYSKEELIHARDILRFLEENTSRIRTVYYRDISQETGEVVTGSFIACREAMQKMNHLFNKKAGNTKEILLGEVGSDFHFLLNQKTEGEEALGKLIKQQIAINLLKEEIPGTLNSFAAKRAELLQKENQKILGALGANSIVAMRNFFEAVVYMVFPLMILVSLLSFGIKSLIQWMHFLLWINIWPPFYVVVKFLLNAIWEYRTKLLFGDSFSLTVFTSEGLADLYSSMESIAAIAMAFIPFLSWILIKGGVSQMVHLSSSIMSPAQTAASTASSEKVYGNYSYGNVNVDNVSGYNTQTFRQNYNGALSQGSVSIDTGMQTATYVPAQDELFIKQGDSYLREGVSRTQAFTGAIQDSFSTSKTALHESSRAVSEGITDTTNKAVGLVQALSNQYQMGENHNRQLSSGLQESHQYIQGIAADYASSKGINQDQALREVISGGLSLSLGIKGGIEGSFQEGSSKFHGDSVVQKAFDSGAFQKHLQTMVNASNGEVASVLQGEDTRMHEDFTRAFNKTASAADQWRAAYSEHQTFSDLKSYSENESVSIHQNLNQRFVEFLKDKYQGDIGKVSEILEMPNEGAHKTALVREFVQDVLPKNYKRDTTIETRATYEEWLGQGPTVSADNYFQDAKEIIQYGQNRLGRQFGEVPRKVEKFKDSLEQEQQGYRSSLEREKANTLRGYEEKRSVVEKETDRSVGDKFWDEAATLNVLKSGLKNGAAKLSASPWSVNQYKELFGCEAPKAKEG